MIGDVSASISALDSMQKAQAVSSNNVANMLTEGYDPVRAVFQATEPAGVKVELRQGGRRADETGEGQGETEEVVAQSAPSGVDLAEETVNQATYSTAHTANANVLRMYGELTGTLVDLFA